MSNENTFDQETIAEVLDAHGVDSIDELPAPVRNNIEAGPDGIDPFHFWRHRGDD
jgi:hypothetical protein